ncbi:TIM barrel protein [Mycolicibacterium sp. S2-37]|uniref:sugar phosphate isomerase/epimerase family protein n=1 Tax=Mycolicibacterium sp. S2-37 TaxID=2810297 RepID=UPI001A93DAC1|nr:TIM barrel protein [Mycolicibacterium sp. S2-37]MBO0677299.1 TIM barrel protein [Mycolicibacterium sp. S2-37]
MHDRLSVHSVTFSGAPLAELHDFWRTAGLNRLSLVDLQLSDPGLAPLIAEHGYRTHAVCHVFSSADALLRVIDASAEIGATMVYLLTGGRGALNWEQAADRFCTAVAPCVSAARGAGVALAIENASSLYADIHIAHSLRDTITLAEAAGLDICIDLFHCWAEAGLETLVDRALPRTRLIQLSDYVLGDRSLPARAVPGDGAIPVEGFLEHVLAAGYRHGFDLELIGPRIESEGRAQAALRAGRTVTAMLDRLGA